MKTKIVVDSSSSLYALPGVDFACVPLKIVTDEQEYLDDGTLDAVDMARSLRTYKGKTSTSCPNVADWLAAYEGAEQIFVATITGTLSGSYNADCWQRKNTRKRTRRPVFLFWTACPPGRSCVCWQSVCGISSGSGWSLTRSARRSWLTTSTHICCFRWNRWPIWPATAV